MNHVHVTSSSITQNSFRINRRDIKKHGLPFGKWWKNDKEKSKGEFHRWTGCCLSTAFSPFFFKKLAHSRELLLSFLSSLTCGFVTIFYTSIYKTHPHENSKLLFNSVRHGMRIFLFSKSQGDLVRVCPLSSRVVARLLRGWLPL